VRGLERYQVLQVSLLAAILAVLAVNAALSYMIYTKMQAQPTQPPVFQGGQQATAPPQPPTGTEASTADNRYTNIDNGVYLWNGTGFEKVDAGPGPFIPNGTGYVILYFHNNMCPWCARLYPALHSYLSSGGSLPAPLYMVVSDWFDSRTNSAAVAATFRFYNVSYSPYMLVIKVGGGRVEVVKEAISGYMEDIYPKTNKAYFEDIEALVNYISSVIAGR